MTALLLLLFAAAPAASQRTEATPPRVEANMDEYVVWEVALRGAKAVLRARTTLEMGIGDKYSPPTERLREEMPGAVDLVSDLLRINANPEPIEGRSLASSIVAVLSDGDYEQIFRNGAGWEEFYRRFPAAAGLTQVSRIAFDTGRTKALMTIGNQKGDLNGLGLLVYLEKDDGTWRVRATRQLWIS